MSSSSSVSNTRSRSNSLPLTLPKPGSNPLSGRATMSRPEVFDYMRDKICLFVSPLGKFSGFFICRNGLMGTCMHSIPKTEPKRGYILLASDPIEMHHNGSLYKVGFPIGFDVTAALERDLCLLKSNKEFQVNYFEPLPESIELKEGMDVYFGGYPLSHDALTFHQGSISSIYNTNGIQCFTIDGTVVPGNSGGPVVVQIKGNIYLAGVIFSEVTDLDPAFAQLQQSFAQAKAAGTLPAMRAGPHNVYDILSVALSAIGRNMSTGIGKAVHSRHLFELTSGQNTDAPLSGPALTSQPGGDLPVIKVPKELKKPLKDNGWKFLRNGKGSHMVFEKDGKTISVPMNPAKGTQISLLRQIEAGDESSSSSEST